MKKLIALMACMFVGYTVSPVWADPHGGHGSPGHVSGGHVSGGHVSGGGAHYHYAPHYSGYSHAGHSGFSLSFGVPLYRGYYSSYYPRSYSTYYPGYYSSCYGSYYNTSPYVYYSTPYVPYSSSTYLYAEPYGVGYPATNSYRAYRPYYEEATPVRPAPRVTVGIEF